MFGDLVGAVLSWQSLLMVLLVFGFLPGVALRLIVLCFHRDDPRRRELLAELYVVPRIERPIWVAQQLEVAVFEGLWDRILWAARRRIIDRRSLASGVAMNREHPKTFWTPDESERLALKAGDMVRLYFQLKDGWGERMWVQVVATKRRHLIGVLRNNPVDMPRLVWGARIKFKPEHVIDIVQEPVDTPEAAQLGSGQPTP